MYSGIYAPNRPFNDSDKHLITIAKPEVAVVRYEQARSHTHNHHDGDYLRSVGVKELVVVVEPDRVDIHFEDIAAAANEFPSAAIQVGNEPDQEIGGDTARMWELRFYLLLALSQRPRYPKAVLLAPPLSCTPRNIQPAKTFLTTPLGTTSLLDVYRQFDGIAIHAYDFWDADEMLKLVDGWHAIFPDKKLWITEYGIDGNVDGEAANKPNKVARYAAFIKSCRTRPYVEMAAMFIAGVGLPGGFKDYEVGEAIAGLAGI